MTLAGAKVALLRKKLRARKRAGVWFVSGQSRLDELCDFRVVETRGSLLRVSEEETAERIKAHTRSASVEEKNDLERE